MGSSKKTHSFFLGKLNKCLRNTILRHSIVIIKIMIYNQVTMAI